MGTYLHMAARNLLQARRRTALLGSALAGVSFLLVLLLALSQGVSETILHSATTISTGHVNIGGFYKAKPSDAYPMITRVDEIREVVAASLEGVALVIDRNRGWGKMISEAGTVQVGMNGVDIAEESRLADQVQLAKESSYRDGGRDVVLGGVADLAQPNTGLIFAAQARRLDVTVGDQVTLSTESMGGSVNTADVRIVAVARDLGFASSWALFVPKQVVRDLYRLNDDTSGAVMVYLDDIDDSEAAMITLRGRLGEAGFELMEHQAEPFWRKFEVVGGEAWTGQKLDVTIWDDEVPFLTWVVGALRSISVLLVSVLLIIIIVGILNTMWIAVRERTGEIGTLRAIGMQRRAVLWMFLSEAAVLGSVATAAGALTGGGLAWLLNVAEIPIEVEAVRAILMSDSLRLSVSAGQILGAVAVFTFFTMLAALWPAYRASRLQPITAIHRVG